MRAARRRDGRHRRGRDVSEDEPWWALIRMTFSSPARLAMLQAQDVLGLGGEARMNTPGRATGSWRWQMAPGALTDEHAKRLRAATEESGRLGGRGRSGFARVAAYRRMGLDNVIVRLPRLTCSLRWPVTPGITRSVRRQRSRVRRLVKTTSAPDAAGQAHQLARAPAAEIDGAPDQPRGGQRVGRRRRGAGHRAGRRRAGLTRRTCRRRRRAVGRRAGLPGRARGGRRRAVAAACRSVRPGTWPASSCSSAACRSDRQGRRPAARRNPAACRSGRPGSRCPGRAGPRSPAASRSAPAGTLAGPGSAPTRAPTGPPSSAR